MTEALLVYGIVLGAAGYLGWRRLPASLRARLVPGGANAASCGKTETGCGAKGCEGCH